MFFARSGKLIGIIAVADVEKPTSCEAIEEFGKLGISAAMLTGDNRLTAEAIRKRIGISRVIAEVLPKDKEKEIQNLQESGKVVAMVGDGIKPAIPVHISPISTPATPARTPPA